MKINLKATDKKPEDKQMTMDEIKKEIELSQKKQKHYLKIQIMCLIGLFINLLWYSLYCLLST